MAALPQFTQRDPRLLGIPQLQELCDRRWTVAGVVIVRINEYRFAALVNPLADINPTSQFS
jgi:hypothetical protein